MPVPSKPFTFSDTPPGTNLIKASEINANYDALYNTLNPASIGVDYSNMAATVDQYFKTLRDTMAQITSGTPGAGSANTWLFGFSSFVLPTASATGIQYLDPARYPAGTRTKKLSIAGSLMVNATAPAITFQVSLYPVSAVAGGSGINTATLGTAVPGSSISFASPGASSRNHSEVEFDFPAADYYALGLATSNAVPANTAVTVLVDLQFRAV